MNRLSKSGIEYLDYHWGFVSGCRNRETGVCPIGDLCWARKTTERFKAHYPQGFEPTIYPEALLSPLKLKKAARIGVCFMGDLFGDWVDPEQPASVTFPDGQTITNCALRDVLKDIILHCPQHTFIFLTKAPWNLHLWEPFPNNAWAGVSVCSSDMMHKAMTNLANVRAGKRWLSFEPLLGCIGMSDHMSMKGVIDLVVIGSLTGTRKDMEAAQKKWPVLTLMPYGRQWTLQPPIEWVRAIVEEADQAGITIWLKDNLLPLFPKGSAGPLWAWEDGCLRQEMPN